MSSRDRKLVSIGLLSPRVCNSTGIEDPIVFGIYEKLKAIGFRETIWQFIYDDQIGGLVYPCAGGQFELHVRFYRDRVFAELEFGRFSPSHFLIPLSNANRYLFSAIENSLTDVERRVLQEMLDRRRQRRQEAALATLRVQGHEALLAHIEATSSKFPFWLSRILSWRCVAFVVANVTLVSSTVSWGIGTGSVVAAVVVMLLSSRLLPKEGRP